MQYTSFTLAAALSVSGAFAQTVHVVTVGGPAGETVYSPNSVVAQAGDLVQFQFNPKNHTVTQSTFANPCVPIQMVSPSTEGFFSGFNPVSAADVDRPAFTVAITDTKPIWVYCSQDKHCQAGMSMVINQNLTANPEASLANYQLASKNVTTEFLIPTAFIGSATTFSNSTSSSNSSSSSSSSSGSNTTVTTGQPPVSNSGSGSSSSGSSSSSSSGSSTTTTASGPAQATGAAAGAVGVSSALSLVAVVAGLFIM